MKLEVYNLKNEKVGEVDVSDEVFGTEVKPHLHYEYVKWQMAKRRAGTHKTKQRAEVAYSTRKIYKQKGTGRARHGSVKAPTFVGGGTVFGPQPRDYSYTLPKKVKRGALRSALSQKVAEGKLKVVEAFPMDRPRTRDALATLTTLGSANALVVDGANEVLKLSIRNLPRSKFLSAEGLNVYDLLKYDHLVITREAVCAIDGVLKS